MIATPDKRYLIQLDITDMDTIDHLPGAGPHIVFHGNFGVDAESIEGDSVRIAAAIMSMIEHYTEEHLDENGEYID
jgi:hypothetical protein